MDGCSTRELLFTYGLFFYVELLFLRVFYFYTYGRGFYVGLFLAGLFFAGGGDSEAVAYADGGDEGVELVVGCEF